MKICIEPGCNRSQFGGSFCAYHQFRRYMRGGDKYKPKNKKQTKIPAKSKKRIKEEKYYAENCKDLTKEIKEQNNGKIHCFFSGKEIIGVVHYHHLKKRIGAFYIDKEWLVPAIDEYHLDYHGKSIDWLLKQGWYAEIFLPNLRKKSGELYQKELRRQEKSHKLNPELFEEDKDFYN